jgi:hypothetical protein
LIAAFFVYKGGKCLQFLKHLQKCIGITSSKNQEEVINTSEEFQKIPGKDITIFILKISKIH